MRGRKKPDTGKLTKINWHEIQQSWCRKYSTYLLSKTINFILRLDQYFRFKGRRAVLEVLKTQVFVKTDHLVNRENESKSTFSYSNKVGTEIIHRTCCARTSTPFVKWTTTCYARHDARFMMPWNRLFYKIWSSGKPEKWVKINFLILEQSWYLNYPANFLSNNI